MHAGVCAVWATKSDCEKRHLDPAVLWHLPVEHCPRIHGWYYTIELQNLQSDVRSLSSSSTFCGRAFSCTVLEAAGHGDFI